MAKKKTTPEAAPALTPLDPANMAILAQAVAAFHNANTPLYLSEAEMQPLLQHPNGPFIEFNRSMTQGDKVICRASVKGMEFLAKASPTNGAATDSPQPQNGGFTSSTTATATAEPAKPPAPPNPNAYDGTPDPTFVLEDGVTIPTLKRGGRGAPKKIYPFAVMEIGQSFHIAKTADNPKPAKRIGPVVSTATKNLNPKSFRVQAVDATDKRGEGCRVWRVT